MDLPAPKAARSEDVTEQARASARGSELGRWTFPEVDRVFGPGGLLNGFAHRHLDRSVSGFKGRIHLEEIATVTTVEPERASRGTG